MEGIKEVPPFEKKLSWKKEVSLKRLLAFEVRVFPLEKEEQALKVTFLKRGWIDAYRGKFLKKAEKSSFEKEDKVPLKKVKTKKTYNLILHKINYAKFLGANTMM